jgi:hypothetical protein
VNRGDKQGEDLSECDLLDCASSTADAGRRGGGSGSTVHKQVMFLHGVPAGGGDYLEDGDDCKNKIAAAER